MNSKIQSVRAYLIACPLLILLGMSPLRAQVDIWVTQFGPGTAKKLIVVGDMAMEIFMINVAKPFPEDCLCDSLGRVYVAESDFEDGTSIIERIETDLSLTTINSADVTVPGDTVVGPEGPSLDAAGNLFMNTRMGPGAHTGVYKFSAGSLEAPPNESPQLAVLPFTEFGEGTAILKTPPFAGHLLAAGTVGVFKADVTGLLPALATLFLTRPGSGVDFVPVGIDISPASDVNISAGDIVVAYSDGVVQRHNSSGTLVDAAYATGLGDALFCEFDLEGNLYVVNFAGEIWKIKPSTKEKVLLNAGNLLEKAVGITVCRIPADRGRMTGGGKVGPATIPPGAHVTYGFELHCDPANTPNNLQITWPRNRFHLETLTSATCRDDLLIEPNPPGAGFDTYEGKGEGRFNGISGYKAMWKFTDAGEPGKNDTAEITITSPAGTEVVLAVSGKLKGGNNQAH